MRHGPLTTPIRSLLLALLVLGGLAACGSDGGSDAAPTDDNTDVATDPGDDATPAPPEDSSTGGSGTGTLTMADGTVYELEMSTCETSDTRDFVIPNSYDLFGRTSDDAFRASFNRAGLDADFISEIVTLEGDFDEDGKNAGILYKSEVDTITLTVDGGDVTGTVSLRSVGGRPGPHDVLMDATVDISC